MSRIIIGNPENPIIESTGADLRQVTGNMSVDLASDELFIDQLTAVNHFVFSLPTIYSPSEAGCIISADGKIYCGHFEGFNLAEEIPYGTPIRYENGGSFWGMFYVAGNIKRMTGHRWEIPAVSIIGLFDKTEHLGGIYTGQTFAQIIAEIFNGSVDATVNGAVTISGTPEACRVEKKLADVKMYGWLPAGKKRKNLHHSLIATGASMTRDNDGTIVFKYLKDLTEEEIEKSRLYVGGSVEYSAEVTGVEVTEHTFQFAYNTDYQNIFDNTNAYAPPAEREKVIFSNPVNPATVRSEGNVTIHEIGNNYAIVSGKGKIEAIPYVHLTRTLQKVKNSSLPSEIKKLNNAYLVSPMNSENVLERAFNFYTQARTVNGNAEIVNEKTGKKYVITNAFNERVRGILYKVSLTQSSFVHGNLEFITGYTPGPFGNNYNEVKLFSGSGSWTVPTWLRQSKFPFIRVTLVGAGGGAQGGYGGKQGRGCWNTGQPDGHGYTKYDGYGGGAGGKGGAGGEPGTPGKVLTIAKLNVANIARIDYECGIGGTGGTKGIGGKGNNVDPVDPGMGSRGSETTIKLYNDNGALVASYSTANGFILPSGIANLATGAVYGLSGISGYAGADGGKGGAAAMGANGEDGESLEVNGIVYPGGTGSLSEYKSVKYTEMYAYCGGGSGGGAAYGARGGDSPKAALALFEMCSWGGDGGTGATPSKTPVNPTAYGQSGDGGHGGGGGGTGGAQNWKGPSGGFHEGIHDGLIGPGGNGTNGANGADGCVFLYS